MKRWLCSTVAALLVVGVAGCGGKDDASGSATPDSGVTLTLWTRAATESISKQYAEAYNASHKNKVQVTAYPIEEYPAKFASAAGA